MCYEDITPQEWILEHLPATFYSYPKRDTLNIAGENYDNNIFNYLFQGSIDDIVLYQRALSESEIYTIYTNLFVDGDTVRSDEASFVPIY